MSVKVEQQTDSIYDIFWDFFVENKSEIEQFEQNPDGVCDAIGKVLSSVAPELDFEMGKHPDGYFEFILIAGGVYNNIEKVVEVYNAAPEIENWVVVPFRPRQFLSPLEFPDRVYDPADFYYQSCVVEDRTCVKIHIKDYTPEAEAAFGSIAFMFMDIILGEFDVMTKIGVVEMDFLPDNPIGIGLKPLSALAEEIDARYGFDA